jgi:hypothetical protein
MSSFIGMAAHANSWVPVIKETLTALAIGLTPLFALLVITPLAGRAFSVMAGMLIWLTAWGIIDAVVHSFAMEFALNSSESLKGADGASGLTAMLMFPSYTTKVAALFGALRWFGLMLSSILTAMLIKFGGTALAMLAGTLAGAPQASGASAGSGVLTNPGHVMSSDLVPKQAWANTAKAIGERNLVRGLLAESTGSMAGRAMTGLALGAETIAKGQFVSSASHLSKAANIDANIVGNLQAMGYSLGESLALGASLGFDPQKVQGFQNLKRMGYIPNGNVFQQAYLYGLFGSKATQLDPTGNQSFKVGPMTYIMDPNGNIIPVEADLGQLDVKSMAVNEAERRIQASEKKAVGEDFTQVIKSLNEESTQFGVENRTMKEFLDRVSHKTSELIEHSNSLKKFDLSKTEQDLFAQLKGDTSSVIKSIVSVGGGYRVTVSTGTGEEKTYTVSHKVGDELSKIREEAFRETTSEFSSSGTKIAKLAEFAEKAGATNLAEYLKSYSIRNVFSSSDSLKENVQFVSFASGIFSKAMGRPVSMEEAASYIQRLAASSNPKDQKLLQDMLQGYSELRVFAAQQAGIQNNINEIAAGVDKRFDALVGRVKQQISQAVPEVKPREPNNNIGKKEFEDHAKSVGEGLDLKGNVLKVFQLPMLGPILAVPYGLGNFIFGDLPKLKSNTIFSSPGDIYRHRPTLNYNSFFTPIYPSFPTDPKNWEQELKGFMNSGNPFYGP